MRTTLVALVAGAALAFPGAADAARFSGKTSQNGGVIIRTGASGAITKLTIGWRARCGPKYVYTSDTVFRGPFDASTPNGFKDVGTYTSPSRVTTGRVTINVGALRASPTEWKGRLSVRVVVRRHGKVIDHCRVRNISWNATQR